MKLPDFSVHRPVFISMVTLIVIILGLRSFARLQIDLLPSIEMPTLTIRTGYEGASPVVMERLVTQIVEEIVATVPGVEELTSESSKGSSSVRVRFNWGNNIDTAAIEVQSRLYSRWYTPIQKIEPYEIFYSNFTRSGADLFSGDLCLCLGL